MMAETTPSSRNTEQYQGFEQGPIRPPSEAHSLLVRVTRNCPWNRCTFCPVYKGSKFSLRPPDHVIRDIDAVADHLDVIQEIADRGRPVNRQTISEAMGDKPGPDMSAFHAALSWYSDGMESIFLQDANSLIIKPGDLIRILQHLRKRFPSTKRITSYARSHTVARISDDHLARMREAGLNRIHIGMESGSDAVLDKVCKGTTKEQHVKAGKKVVAAGMELSEYVMPGLGGRELTMEHALESADALNRIDPHFIRLRSLAVPPGLPLYDALQAGEFTQLRDVEVAGEILLFLESLEGIRSTIRSDHILNLFEDVEGTLPDDKEAMCSVVREFLAMEPEKRTLFQVGRRLGVFRSLADVDQPQRAARVREVVRQYGVTPDNVDETIRQLMARFI
ncbi:MAG: radical SAM protein [Desulfatibacillaceae bacterium]